MLINDQVLHFAVEKTGLDLSLTVTNPGTEVTRVYEAVINETPESAQGHFALRQMNARDIRYKNFHVYNPRGTSHNFPPMDTTIAVTRRTAGKALPQTGFFFVTHDTYRDFLNSQAGNPAEFKLFTLTGKLRAGLSSNTPAIN